VPARRDRRLPEEPHGQERPLRVEGVAERARVPGEPRGEEHDVRDLRGGLEELAQPRAQVAAYGARATVAEVDVVDDEGAGGSPAPGARGAGGRLGVGGDEGLVEVENDLIVDVG